MQLNVAREIAALERMTTDELRQRYAESFGEATTARNKVWLVKRIAWRLQARAEGGLTERAKARAAELADDADLRLNAPPMKAPPPAEPVAVRELPFASDDRLPPPGTVLVRKYKGRELQVKVRTDGFEHEGELFASLSAVAKRITGSHCSGYLFFRLERKGGAV